MSLKYELFLIQDNEAKHMFKYGWIQLIVFL